MLSLRQYVAICGITAVKSEKLTMTVKTRLVVNSSLFYKQNLGGKYYNAIESTVKLAYFVEQR